MHSTYNNRGYKPIREGNQIREAVQYNYNFTVVTNYGKKYNRLYRMKVKAKSVLSLYVINCLTYFVITRNICGIVNF